MLLSLGEAFTFAGRSPELRPATSAWVASPLLGVAMLIYWSALDLARSITKTTRKAQIELDDEYSKWYLIFF